MALFPSRALTRAAGSAALLAAVALGGCQALGGGGGVMPAGDVGLPPSLRGTVPGQAGVAANLDDEGRPLQTAPTRRLDLPQNARGAARADAQSERRIRREDIEGSAQGGGSGGGSVGPAMTPGGGMGLGGRF